MMEFGAEFFVLLGLPRLRLPAGLSRRASHVLKALDARGEAIADELAQAAKLRARRRSRCSPASRRRPPRPRRSAAAIVAEARAQAEQLAKDAAVRMEEFVARRTKQAEAKIAFAEAQAAADVRAAAADHAAKAAEIVLRDRDAGLDRRGSRVARDWRA